MNIRKISPMVRAIGTMGAVVAIAGGVTFANLGSTAVKLSPNTLTAATATLSIAGGTNCPGGNTTSITGLTDTLVPGVASATFPFCLDNTGDLPLGITAQIPTDLTSSPIPAADVTLTLTCPTIGTLSGTLNDYASPVAFPGSDLAVTTPEDCTASATLSSSWTGSGSTVTPFDIDFVGNQ